MTHIDFVINWGSEGMIWLYAGAIFAFGSIFMSIRSDRKKRSTTPGMVLHLTLPELGKYIDDVFDKVPTESTSYHDIHRFTIERYDKRTVPNDDRYHVTASGEVIDSIVTKDARQKFKDRYKIKEKSVYTE